MPILQNPRQEIFANARASGALLDDAYERAGFKPGHGHASRLSRRPEVAERIADVRATLTLAEEVGPQDVIASLLQLAKAGEALATPAGIAEARATLLEVCRLQAQIAEERRLERKRIISE